jgi:enoyl-CoA hydratase/carnithine racemase
MDIAEHGPSWRADRDHEGRWTLWLDRPRHSQNSLDTDSLRELEELLSQVEGDPGTSSLILRSAKPKGFCTGADLKELRAFTTIEQVEAFARRGGQVFDRLTRLRAPSLAIIRGACLGGGLELALSCTRRVVESAATLGLPEVKLGLVPGWGATRRLPRLIGLAATLDLLLSGRSIEAPEARNLGLVDAIIPPGEPTDLGGTSRSHEVPDDWREQLSAARESLPDDELRPARERLIDILSTELRDGGHAAERSLAELVFEPKGRASLESFASKHGAH